MKIGFVLDDTLDSTDGVQQYVLTVGEWLRDQGHDVHYIVGKSSRSDVKNVHSFGKQVRVKFNGNVVPLALPASPRKIQAMLSRQKFDVLHIQMPYSPLLAARVIELAPTKTAIVGTFHIAPFSSFQKAASKLLGYIVRPSLQRFDEVISVSSTAQKIAKQTFKVDSVLIPNTVNVKNFQTSISKRLTTKKTIVFLGRLVPRKGCKYLLKAIHELLHDSGENLKIAVYICGDGPERAKLEAYTKKSGLSDIVTFTGRLAEPDKPRYLGAADLVVFPSVSGESFGIVLIEAMSAARPGAIVLAGDNPGYSEVMSQTPEVLFDPKSDTDLKDLMMRYLADKQKCAVIHDKQKEIVASYDVGVVGPKIQAIYTKAIAKRLNESHNKG